MSHDRSTQPPPPTWLSEPCPTWCTREHLDDDHPDDRFHQSEARFVAAIASPAAVPDPAALASLDLVVRAGRHLGHDLTWIQVSAAEAAHPTLVLSLDSALLLGGAIAAAAADVGRE
ncbi:hypothetical protein [Nocardioides sp.]|uniref:DUF6907 domain-containing protein n=1 Tax=Nocardioides sp. TaxID=35761 RepID=UPI003516DB25